MADGARAPAVCLREDLPKTSSMVVTQTEEAQDEPAFRLGGRVRRTDDLLRHTAA